ncbi:Metal-dependent hydrolase, beta-lactamase superfamily II [Thalassobacillus cyri]|uniref:Metal-dependent hydrolase, beta-lactamase superfamily II n=1 Tax=Thalassobacillus cyri TaxID=571932 RepID=A0A1H4CQ42_9BACI|nr:MBL fold metallo-hydrolase [Thalassobacillus cyri]SEA62473.1 Metal-dependent hydrolase, beta-lactamase superfamily II [Thalassobacillus cyri]
MLRFLFLLLLSLVMTGASQPQESQYEPKERSQAKITFFNLADGEATLLQTDRKKYYLINTGEHDSYKQLIEELERFDVKTIEGIILTGQTNDYCGNMNKLIEEYQVERIYHTGTIQTNCQPEADVTTTTWKEDDEVQLDGISMKVIFTDEEKMSLHLSFYETGVIFFAKGDIEEEIHITKKSLPPFQILKIGEYGTGNAPTEQFLEKTDPHMAVIFTRNGSAVNDGLIERMHGFWMDVYRLQQTGTTTIEMDKDQYNVPSD